MGKTVDFYFDIVCPFAYMGSVMLEKVAAKNNSKINWKPVLLGGIYDLIKAPQGKAGSASDVDPPAKKILRSQDMFRNAAQMGFNLSWHPDHPVKSLKAMRMLVLTPEEKRGKLARALYDAYWVKHLNTADSALLLQIAKENGVTFDESVFEDQRAKDGLRANTQEAVDRGAPGVPFFYIDGEYYWGVDRIHFVDRALGNQKAAQVRALSQPNPAARAKPRTLTMFYDFSSPWSYIGSTQIDRIVKEAGANVKLELVPILLGALFKEIGTPNVPMLAMSDQKREYLGKDMQDWLQWWGGVPFQFSTQFPLRTVLPLRVAIVEPKTFHAIYKAAWVDNKNIGDPAVLIEVLNANGFNGRALVEASEAEKVKEQLKLNNQRASKAGVIGVPSFQVDGGDVIWGQDRFNVILDLLDGWQPSGPSSKL